MATITATNPLDETGETELEVEFEYYPGRVSHDIEQPDDPEELEVLGVRDATGADISGQLNDRELKELKAACWAEVRKSKN